MSARAQRIDERVEADAVRDAAREEIILTLMRHRSYVDRMDIADARAVTEIESSEQAGGHSREG